MGLTPCQRSRSNSPISAPVRLGRGNMTQSHQPTTLRALEDGFTGLHTKTIITVCRSRRTRTPLFHLAFRLSQLRRPIHPVFLCVHSLALPHALFGKPPIFCIHLCIVGKCLMVSISQTISLWVCDEGIQLCEFLGACISPGLNSLYFYQVFGQSIFVSFLRPTQQVVLRDRRFVG